MLDSYKASTHQFMDLAKVWRRSRLHAIRELCSVTGRPARPWASGDVSCDLACLAKAFGRLVHITLEFNPNPGPVLLCSVAKVAHLLWRGHTRRPRRNRREQDHLVKLSSGQRQ